MTKFTLNLTQIFEEDRKKNKLLKQKIKKLLSYDDIMMELQLDYDGITDGTTMVLQMELRWRKRPRLCL